MAVRKPYNANSTSHALTKMFWILKNVHKDIILLKLNILSFNSLYMGTFQMFEEVFEQENHLLTYKEKVSKFVL